jgi:hypothetical protein
MILMLEIQHFTQMVIGIAIGIGQILFEYKVQIFYMLQININHKQIKLRLVL